MGAAIIAGISTLFTVGGTIFTNVSNRNQLEAQMEADRLAAYEREERMNTIIPLVLIGLAVFFAILFILKKS